MEQLIKDPLARRDGTTLQNTAQATLVQQPQAKVGVRDFLEGQGATDVTWNPNASGVTAKINGNTMFFDTSNMTNNNGRLEGTQSDIDKMLKGGKAQVRQTGVNNGVWVGYDQNNNPTYNGQALDTTGMVNVDGRWYGNGDYVNQMAKTAANRYENPYQGTRDKLLDDLLNYKKYSYNPSEDESLENAMELARRAAMRSAVDRGVGNSSIAEYASAAAANQLIPQYEEKQYQRYLADRDYLGQLLGYVNNSEGQDMNVWNINNENRINDRNFGAGLQKTYDANKRYAEQLAYERAQAGQTAALNSALTRLQITGVVDGQDAEILGLPAGTTSMEARNYMRELALNLFQIMGYADNTVARILNIPAGTSTLQGLEYNQQLLTPKKTYSPTSPSSGVGTDYLSGPLDAAI